MTLLCRLDEEEAPLSSWLKLKSEPQKCSDPERNLDDTEERTVFKDDLEVLLR